MRDSFSTIEQTFSARGDNVAVMFRIGEAPAPSARSIRRAPEYVDDIL